MGVENFFHLLCNFLVFAPEDCGEVPSNFHEQLEEHAISLLNPKDDDGRPCVYESDGNEIHGLTPKSFNKPVLSEDGTEIVGTFLMDKGPLGDWETVLLSVTFSMFRKFGKWDVKHRVHKQRDPKSNEDSRARIRQREILERITKLEKRIGEL